MTNNNKWLDFALALISIDFLFFVILLIWRLCVNSIEDVPDLSLINIWMKVGLFYMVMQKVPLRFKSTPDKIAYTQLWLLSLVWPMLIKTLSSNNTK